jgi:NADH-quinone oxidoreductase subunit E
MCECEQETLDLEPLNKVIDELSDKNGTLIPVLQRAQDIYGYLPPQVLRHISERMGAPLSQVYGVVTFYSQFYLTRRGKCIVRQCDGTACHVRGAWMPSRRNWG